MKVLKLAIMTFILALLLLSCSFDFLGGEKKIKVIRIRVEGVISDEENGKSLKNALIEINQEKSKTDKEGRFIIPRVNIISPLIAPPIKVTADGYHPYYGILEVSKKDLRYKYKECEFQLIPHSAPTNLRYCPGDTRVKLQWKPPNSGNPLGYNIYLETSDIPVNAEPIKELSYIDLGLTNGVEHIYFVRAVLEIREDGSLIESPASNKVYVTPRSIKYMGKEDIIEEKEKSEENNI